MDLSKLPKLSQRPAETPADPTLGADPLPVEGIPASTPPPLSVQSAAPAQPRYAEPHPPGNPYSLGQIGFVETWMSVGIGIFVLMYNPRFLEWIKTKMNHSEFSWTFDDGNGGSLPYRSTIFFFSDLGTTLFGIVLILDGLLFLTRRKTPVMVALGLTIASTIFNSWWLLHSYFQLNDFPVVSFLAVLFGGMMLSSQWLAFKSFPK